MGLIPLPLHIWDGGHQILQEIKLLLQFNALLPEGGGASAGHAPFVPQATPRPAPQPTNQLRGECGKRCSARSEQDDEGEELR